MAQNRFRNRLPASVRSMQRLRRRRRVAGPESPHLSVNPVRALLCAGTVLLLSVVLSIHFLPDRVTMEIGDRSPVEIRANRSVTYVDTEATLRQRQAAADRVPRIYDPEPAAQAQADRVIADIFNRIRLARAEEAPGGLKRKAERLSADMGSVLSLELIHRLLATPPPALDRLQQETSRLVQAEMAVGIRSGTDDLEHARRDLERNARRAVGAPGDQLALMAVGGAALRHNLIYNRARTDRERDAARRRAQMVYAEVHLGDTVIRQGEIFTREHLDKCTALGLVSPRMDGVTALSIVALSAGMALLVAYYLRRWRPAIYAQPRLLFLLSAIVIVSVFGLKLFGTTLGIPLSAAQFGYIGMMTVVSAGMMITVLLDGPLAVLVTGLLSVQSGLIMNHEIRFSVMTLLSSLVGIYSVSNIRDRTDLIRATLAVAGANVAMVWVLGGLLGDTTRELLPGSAWAIAAAAIAVALFGFGVAALEKPFNILTHVWLLELSASDRPLLRELCLAAPGTYAHSIMVGNLAQAGAEAVGADPLFCRVASYYHDIGKMRRPHCFIENQRMENIHDKLAPSLSALVISAHIRDGLDLADTYRLPAQIKDVIAQHHGTSLIRYFYALAITESGGAQGGSALEQHFRYDGPKPQTREIGIIMLADVVEAAARCLDRPTPARLDGLVEALVKEKLEDGQLDECDLTFKDIKLIQAAFVTVLSAMHHGRIDYPELPRIDTRQTAVSAAALEMRQTERNGGNHTECPEVEDAGTEDKASRAQSAG